MTRDRHRQLTDFQKAKEKEAKEMSLSIIKKRSGSWCRWNARVFN